MWKDLTLGQRQEVINLAAKRGLKDLNEIQQMYDSAQQDDIVTSENGFSIGMNDLKELMDSSMKLAQYDNGVNTFEYGGPTKPNFVLRLEDPNRKYIKDWVNSDYIATHKLGWFTEGDHAVVYPEVQEINGKLIDFTRPPYSRNAGMQSAIEKGDTLRMTPRQAQFYTQMYKGLYPKGNTFAEGGLMGPDDPEELARQLRAAVDDGYRNTVTAQQNNTKVNTPTQKVELPLVWDKDKMDPTKNKTGWFEWWMNNRGEQLKKAAKHLNQTSGIFRTQQTIGRQAEAIKDNYLSGIYEAEESAYDRHNKNASTISGFPNALHTKAKDVAFNNLKAIYKDVETPEEALNIKRYMSYGTTYPESGTIIYYPRDGKIANSTIVHERNHAGDGNVLSGGFLPYQILPATVYGLWDKKNPVLQKDKEEDSYLDMNKEIKSRLMEFRYLNKINPKHIWTLDEIKKWRTNGAFYEQDLDRYTDEFLLHLFNDVADNSVNKTDDNIVDRMV